VRWTHTPLSLSHTHTQMLLSTSQVTYTPKHTGTFSSESFTVSTAGGNKLTLGLQGSAVGPKVTLSAAFFNYGNVPAGQAPTKVWG
jgi:hypothetical protein